MDRLVPKPMAAGPTQRVEDNAFHPFLRSCFENLAVGSQPNLIHSAANVSRDENGDGIGQVRFLACVERRCASN